MLVESSAETWQSHDRPAVHGKNYVLHLQSCTIRRSTRSHVGYKHTPILIQSQARGECRRNRLRPRLNLGSMYGAVAFEPLVDKPDGCHRDAKPQHFATADL